MPTTTLSCACSFSLKLMCGYGIQLGRELDHREILMPLDLEECERVRRAVLGYVGIASFGWDGDGRLYGSSDRLEGMQW